jgi:hypothetical protein
MCLTVVATNGALADPAMGNHATGQLRVIPEK